ncbi:MAG: anaerobic glycerol-3-phosphate dehydrogenase subunit A [Muribaculaceae bacterium]
MDNYGESHFDVIIIGGGATGAGTARDCAMRGLKVLLVERHDFASGATGRNHGLLHSGARYAVTDRESAEECIKENMILRRIAAHCVEENDGLFITLPEDDLAYQAKFVEACTAAGIRADVIDPALARRLEPSVNPELIGAVRIPDGSIDPFRLTTANVIDAQMHGAKVLTMHELTGFVIENGRMKGVKLFDHRSKQSKTVYASLTVNAGGIWGHNIAKMAGITVNMFPAKGALLVFGHRVNNMVINRCRKPANADILVPGDLICVIGTTSSRVPFEECDNMYVTREEVDLLLSEGEKLAPSLRNTRILRAYAGVRPLVASDSDPSGRSISRGIVLLDHETRDGLAGFITITGGKLMTYRLMAEWCADLVCRKLNNDSKCRTAEIPLPGSSKAEAPARKFYDIHGSAQGPRYSLDGQPQPARDAAAPYSTSASQCETADKAAEWRHGSMSDKIDAADAASKALVCECEEVTVAEVEYAIKNLHIDDLVDLRRRTRVGMGTCQGELCACRAAGQLAKAGRCARDAQDNLEKLLQERWKGMYPVAWGHTVSEIQFTSWIYEGVYGLPATDKP